MNAITHFCFLMILSNVKIILTLIVGQDINLHGNVDTSDYNASFPAVFPVKYFIQNAKTKWTEFTRTNRRHDIVIHTSYVTTKGLLM